MNKRLFLILSAFLLLFSLIEKGWTIETYRPETSVAGFIQLPVADDKCITSIRDGDFSRGTFVEPNPLISTIVPGQLFPPLIQ